MIPLLCIFAVYWHSTLSVLIHEFYAFGPDTDWTIGPTLDGSSNATMDIYLPYYNKTYSSLFVSIIALYLVGNEILMFL